MAIPDERRRQPSERERTRPGRGRPAGESELVSRRELGPALLRKTTQLLEVPAGIAAGIGLVTAERRMQENQPRDPTILFIEADHYNEHENDAPQADLKAGNLDRNAWEQDTDILGYLQYYKPAALYTDRSAINHAAKLDYYYAVPTLRKWQPEAMYQGRKGVFVFSGDNPFSALLEESSLYGMDKKFDAAEKAQLDQTKYSAENIIDAVTGLLLTASTSAGVVVSRRKLLGGMAGLTALTVFLGNDTLNQFSQIPQNDWLAARDALAIAKTEYGAKLLREHPNPSNPLMQPETKSAIIMGSSHGSNADTFMSHGGTATRDTAIINFARNTVRIMLAVLEEQYHRKLSQEEIDHTTTRILKNFASMRIAHVSTPESSERINPSALEDYVDSHVQFVFPNPILCPQIVDTIAPLFPSHY